MLGEPPFLESMDSIVIVMAEKNPKNIKVGNASFLGDSDSKYFN